MINIRDYKEVLYKVRRIAAIENAGKEADHIDVENIGHIDLEKIREERNNSDLLTYLNALDHECVRVIMAVMYIGRDFELTDYDYRQIYGDVNEEEFVERDIENDDHIKMVPIGNPDYEVQKYMAFGGDSKDLDVNQIYEKRTSLKKYLDRAFVILGL